MKILALDLGTKLGWAKFCTYAGTEACTLELASDKNLRYAKKLRMDRRLDIRIAALTDWLERQVSVNLCVFEDVKFASSQAQAHLWASSREEERERIRNLPPEPLIVIPEVKTCCKCGETKPGSEFHLRKNRGTLRGRCKKCTYESQKPYNQAHAEQCRESQRRYRKNNLAKVNAVKRVRRRFVERGISEQLFDSLYAEESRCRICNYEFKSKSEACVDHCHVSGKFRGLLCSSCNTGLGYFRDSVVALASAIKYLKGAL